MKILFVNHTAQVSGAELAMLDLIKGLQPADTCMLACPQGRLAELAGDRGVEVASVVGTAGSLKLHPVRTTVAVEELVRTGVASRRIARRIGADIIDSGSIRAGLACAVPALRRAPPVAVHVQDVLPPGRVSRATVETLGRRSAALIASSEFTASGVAPWPAHVIPLPIDWEAFVPDRLTTNEARSRNGVPERAAVLAIVGQITPWKGQDFAIETLASLRQRGIDAMLLVVGAATFTSAATRFDNLAYERALRALVSELGVEAHVRFLGHRDDLAEVLRCADILVMASHGEPFGRVVVEAMAMGVPVVAADEGGPRETIRHQQDGLLVPSRDADAWAAEIAGLLDAPARRAAMGASGRVHAEQYRTERYAAAVRRVYDEVLSGREARD